MIISNDRANPERYDGAIIGGKWVPMSEWTLAMLALNASELAGYVPAPPKSNGTKRPK